MVTAFVMVATISQPSNNTDALLTCPRSAGQFIFQIPHRASSQRTLRLPEQMPNIVFLNKVPSETNAGCLLVCENICVNEDLQCNHWVRCGEGVPKPIWSLPALGSDQAQTSRTQRVGNNDISDHRVGHPKVIELLRPSPSWQPAVARGLHEGELNPSVWRDIAEV